VRRIVSAGIVPGIPRVAGDQQMCQLRAHVRSDGEDLALLVTQDTRNAYFCCVVRLAYNLGKLVRLHAAAAPGTPSSPYAAGKHLAEPSQTRQCALRKL
jgi:hypothetical protein